MGPLHVEMSKIRTLVFSQKTAWMRDESGRQFATHVAAANAACPASCFFGFAKLSGVWLSPHRTVFFGLFKPVEIPGTNDTTRSKVGSAVGQQYVVFKTVMFVNMLSLLLHGKIWWPLAGHSLCREAWLRFLGLGKNRLRRTRKRHRGLDERGLKSGGFALLFFASNIFGHYVLLTSLFNPRRLFPFWCLWAC